MGWKRLKRAKLVQSARRVQATADRQASLTQVTRGVKAIARQVVKQGRANG